MASLAAAAAAAVASVAVFSPPNPFLGRLPFPSSYAVTSSLSVTCRLSHNRSGFTLIAQRRWPRPKAPGPSLSVRFSSDKVLNSVNVPFEALNILENEVLRQGMKE